jgi:hypothetical protein
LKKKLPYIIAAIAVIVAIIIWWLKFRPRPTPCNCSGTGTTTGTGTGDKLSFDAASLPGPTKGNLSFTVLGQNNPGAGIYTIDQSTVGYVNGQNNQWSQDYDFESFNFDYMQQNGGLTVTLIPPSPGSSKTMYFRRVDTLSP